MDHDRGLLLAVMVDVESAEPLGQVEVDLRGAALPVAADGVAQHVFELRSVERALARVDRGLDASAGLLLDLLQDAGHHVFRMIPHLVRADALVRAGRELHDDLVETEIGIGREDQVVDLQALLGHLIFRAEDMRIVLREAAHAHQAMHRARRLVAMHGAELRKAQRQIAIGFQPVLEDLHVARAVHRLESEDALVLGLVAGRLHGEHVLAIPAPVARGLPQRGLSSICGALTSL